MVWIEFLTAALLIAVSGTALTVYADRLGDKLDISGALIGLILLSVVTSLPELGTTFPVVAYIGNPDLAAGNIFGSNTFNMLVLVILDFLLGGASIFALARVSHSRSAALAIIMTIIAVAAMAGGWGGIMGGKVGYGSLLLLIAYVAGIYFIYQEEKNTPHPDTDDVKESVAKEVAVVLVSGLVVAGSGYWLAYIADDIAKITGWGESFVGYLFLAVTTSLPELVVSIASLKLKAYDMAIANTLGSCFFNILMFSIVDPFYHLPVLQDMNRANIGLAVVSMTMIAVAATALYAGRRGKNPSIAKWILAGLYLLGSWVVFSPS